MRKKKHYYRQATTQLREINQALVIASLKQHELAEAAVAAQAVLRESKEREHLAAVLEERNRLACEIHDTLAQAFTGILIQVGVARRIANHQPEEAWEIIAHVGDLARQGLKEARRSVWALQSESLEYSDIATTLPRTVAHMTSDTTLHGEVHIHGTPRLLPADVGMNLLRITQEALNNAARHAGAAHVFVDLTFEGEQVRLCIQDDGQGFDPCIRSEEQRFAPEHQEESGGFGLIGMQQRAERIGGKLTLTSLPGRGTEVAVVATIATTEGRREAV